MTVAALRFGVGIRLSNSGTSSTSSAPPVNEGNTIAQYSYYTCRASISSDCPLLDAALARSQRLSADSVTSSNAPMVVMTTPSGGVTCSASSGAACEEHGRGGSSSYGGSKHRDDGCGEAVHVDVEVILPTDVSPQHGPAHCGLAHSMAERPSAKSKADVKTHLAAGIAELSESKRVRWAALWSAASPHTCNRPEVSAGSNAQLLDPEAGCFNDHGLQSMDHMAVTATSQPPVVPRMIKAADQNKQGNAGIASVPGLGVREVLLHSLPLTLTVFFLVISRTSAFKLKALLSSDHHSVSLQLGNIGRISLSASLVVQLTGIMSSDASFRYEMLATPCLLPFVLTSVVTMTVHRASISQRGLAGWIAPFREAGARSMGAAAALAGALALAQLVRCGGTGSPAYLLGYYLSTWMGRGYIAVTGVIGMLATFISGSVMAGALTAIGT